MSSRSLVSAVPAAEPLRRRPARIRRPLIAVHGLLAVALTLAGGLTITATSAVTALASPTRTDPVVLGVSADFGVLGAATVTNAGHSVVSGDVGVSPGTAITGFPPGVVINGTLEGGTSVAAAAHADAATAYDDAAGRAAATIPSTLGGQTLTPGVYTAATPALALAGTLTLDAQGDPNAVFIIKAGSTLTTLAESTVALTGSASACNVFWQVGTSATLGVGSSFAGTLLASGSITATTGVSVNGRLLARTAAVTLDANAVTTPHCSTVALTTSASPVHFGSPVTLTATVGPPSATGSVVFSDVPSTGPDSGAAVDLGTAIVSGGVAIFTATLPSFGLHTVVATYGGDGTNRSAVSPAVTVEVAGYSGEVIVREFRQSGPAGANDSYVELYNTGPAVPLAGFSVKSYSGDNTTLPASAPMLGTGHSYLLTGAAYSLASVAATDDPVSSLGSGGIKVQAPDTAGTRTDAVGPQTGLHLGDALPAVSGSPTDQYAWVRLESAGVPDNSGNNASDFMLVSTSGAVIGGVQSALGSPAPLATASPYQQNAVLQSTLLDPAVASTKGANFSYSSATKILTIRRTITNSSGVPVTHAVLRTTALSEANGAPEPAVRTQPTRPASMRVLDPPATTKQVKLSNGATVTVQNLRVSAPATADPGGGLNTTLNVPLGAGLAAGRSVSVSISFQVDSGSVWWFVYDVDATSTVAPAASGRSRSALGGGPAGPGKAATPVATRPTGGRPSKDAGGLGTVR